MNKYKMYFGDRDPADNLWGGEEQGKKVSEMSPMFLIWATW